MFLTIKYSHFCRSVRLHHKYADQPDDRAFNPKLNVKSGWNPPREHYDLEENLYKIRQELLENFTLVEEQFLKNGEVCVTLRKTPWFASWLQTKALDLHLFLPNGWKMKPSNNLMTLNLTPKSQRMTRHLDVKR